MFTEAERGYLLVALVRWKASVERAKAKASNPKFAVIYDEDLRICAQLVMKVQAMEVKK